MIFEELINWINNRQTEWTDGFSPIDEVIKMHTRISALETEKYEVEKQLVDAEMERNKATERAEKAEGALVKSFQDGYDAGYKYAKSGAGRRGGGGLQGREA